MIYTIGRTENYEVYFREQGTPRKKGRDPETRYPGGSVWRTPEEAAAEAPPGYSVYGVLADWERDVRPSETPGVSWCDLLVDAELVRLNP